MPRPKPRRQPPAPRGVRALVSRIPEAAGSAMAGLPVWVQGIAWVGVPSAIACFFVWWMTSSVTVRLTAIETFLAKHQQDSATDIQQTWQLIAINERVCLNTSKTNEDRVACVTMGRAPQ